MIDEIYFQAHRGSVDEAPENTMAAYRHAWRLPGAIPEIDIRRTKDGVMICLHDRTLARTTNAPDVIKDRPVSELTLAEIQCWDAGIGFDSRFAGEKVPLLEDVFAELAAVPGRQLYIDLKGVDLAELKAMAIQYNVVDRLIFVHSQQAKLLEVQQAFANAKTMTWRGDSLAEIKREFEALAATQFAGISQLQFPLYPRQREPHIEYTLPPDFLQETFSQLQAAGVEMQVRPFAFDARSLRALLDIGIRWFVADAPEALAAALKRAVANRPIEIVCHKGANTHAPENTYAAAQLCIDWGMDYVEIDVNTSQDGVLYLFHGPEVEETTDGQGEFSTLTAAEIDQLDAGRWFDPQFTGERIPRLEPFLRWIKGKSKLFVDVKAADLSQLIALIYEIGLEKDCFFWFGKAEAALEFRRLDSQLPLKINVSTVADVIEASEKFQANIVEIELADMSQDLVAACWERQLKIMIYHKENDLQAFREILDWQAELVNLNHGDVFAQVAADWASDKGLT